MVVATGKSTSAGGYRKPTLDSPSRLRSGQATLGHPLLPTCDLRSQIGAPAMCMFMSYAGLKPRFSTGPLRGSRIASIRFCAGVCERGGALKLVPGEGAAVEGAF